MLYWLDNRFYQKPHLGVQVDEPSLISHFSFILFWKISLKIGNNNKVEYINIYDSYKSNLKAFSKQIFDPFRRKNQIILIFEKNKNNKFKINFKNTLHNNKNSNYIKTTIGQLNFFKWIIENNIYLK